MEPIIAPIKTGDTGAAVANLQDALLALLEQKKILQPPGTTGLPTPDELQKLTEGLKQERDQSQFGKATQQLIIDFQVQQGLPGSVRDLGVEEKTADKLNELLKAIGAFDGDTSMIVRGTVTTADDQPIRGASVIVFERDLRIPQKCGTAETNDRGEYLISFGPARFSLGDLPSAPTPKLIVRAFLGDQQIGNDVSRPHPTRDEVVNFKTLAPPAPVVSEWEQLSIRVMPLLEGQGKENQALPPSEVNDGDLDFIAEETGLDRKHIRLWALAFVVGQDSAAAMQPATGLSAAPGMATTAFFNPAGTDRLSAFAIFYGWFRLGLPAEPVALWATPTEKLLTTLSTAIAQGIIPSSIGADLDGISKRIEQIKLDRVLQAPALGTAARLGDLLAMAPDSLGLDQQRVLAAAVTDLRPDDPQLHLEIAKLPGFGGVGVAAGVAGTLRLGALTGGHLPLVQALQLQLQHAPESEGTLSPLAAIRPDEWLDLAYTHGTPEGITISPVAYADALSASVEQQHPTATLAAHFTEGRRLARHPALTDVGTFLSENTDFDIVTANLNAVTDQAKLGGIQEPQQVQLVAGLRALQRMNVLGASWDETAALLENDLYSPHQLLVAGPTQLATRLDGRIAPERAAALYRQAENLYSTTIAAFTAGFSPLSAPRIMPTIQFGIPPGADDGPGGVVLPADPHSGGGIPNTDGPSGSVKLAELADAVAHKMASRDRALDPGWGRVVPPPRAGIVIPDTPHFSPGSVIDHQPTLQALFGSQDACACGHCNSVLSPAAYFVDVVEFIKNANLHWLLLGRRPDLQDIELSCNNTNTVVPAIDLALEILENAVAFTPSIDVPLPPGLDVEALLVPTVGVEVRDALQKTVRTLSAKLNAMIARAHADGTTDWTIADGFRRWALTLQSRGLRSVTDTGIRRQMDLAGIELPVWIAALDQGQVANGGEAAFASLLLPDFLSPPDLTNYGKTIIPQGGPGGKSQSWRIEFRVAAQLRFGNQSSLILQTPGGVVWWEKTYNPATLQAVAIDLANGVLPTLVKEPFAARFGPTPDLLFALTATNVWSIGSTKREFTLTFSPASLTLNSLTYQSGDPQADAIAWPENHNPAAYAKLKGDDAVFPWSLPLDLPLEEVRLFLDRARSSRLRLIALMLPVDQQLLEDASGNTLPAATSTPEDTPLVFSVANHNAVTVDGRTEEDTLTTTVGVTNGMLTVLVFPGANIKNNGRQLVTIIGNATAINGALDGMTFNPTADYKGGATLTITTTDAAGTRTLVDRRKLSITAVADMAGDTAATEEDHAVIISVLANDSFENTGRAITAVNGLAITAGGPAVAVAHGTVALNVLAQLIFTPALDYNGLASFTYTVTSGEVMETATVDVSVNSASAASFALEVLGLSQAEARLIAQPPLDLYKCWGVSSGQTTIWDASAGGMVTGTSPLVLLKNVSILLQQSRLSFEELQAVFATQFVQGGAGPLVIEPQNICKPSEMTVAALTAGHLDRIHRLTRLWRKLGWTMRELDLAIQAFGGQLTPDTLISLARLQQLNQQLELPVASLVGGIHLLETQPWTEYLTEGATVHPSLYSTIFQREAVRAVSDFADFALQSDGKELKNTNLSISARADYIGACLRTKPSVVVDWVSPTQGLGIEDKLNRANLSRLTAAAGLCRAVNIAPDKLTHHLKLYFATASPFQSVMSANDRAKATLEFVERLRSIERSGVEVETLRYLLQHDTAPGSNVDLDEKQLTAELAEAAREAVRSISDAPEKTPPVAPAGPESVAAGKAREKEAFRIAQENAALVLAARVARENAVITALATGLGAARELVDDLLRIRLRNPANPGNAAIEVFLSPLGDFIDLSSLVGKLRTHADPISAYLWNAFSAEDQRVLTNPASTALEQQTTLVAALNQVLQGASIYEASRFAGVHLSRETLALISASPTGANLMRLNRLLLEEAYALEIAKRRLPDMSFVAGDLSQPLRAAVESVLVRLHKTTLLCDALKLSRADLPLLRTSATDTCGFTTLDFNTLPVASGTTPTSIVGFEQLLALAKLRGLASGAGDLLHQHAALNFLSPAPPAAWNTEAVFQVLMTGLTLTRDEVEAAANQLRIITAEQYRDPIMLTRFIELLTALKQLDATVKQATDLTAPSPHDAAAISARELLRDKYGEAQWHDLIKPIADKLRERQRDALVDYLINFNQLRGADDLYEHYLIDVQTGSCLKTTRLLQATAAVQLFVQRVLLNLEKDVSLGDDKRKLWDWMHNYRVWEANRKVFLYPENWLLPELRDDKTATFRQMESALTEQEPSPEITRAALLGYLDDLGELAQINVIAMYQERHTLYVVGRTPDQPYRYFWRSCSKFGGSEMSWGSWEALDLDNANDFILPFVYEGDLHVAWPVFRKTKDKVDENNLEWEVQLAWTRRAEKGWIKRKLTKSQLSVNRLPNKDEANSFVFRLTKGTSPTGYFSDDNTPLVREKIEIACYAANEHNPISTIQVNPTLDVLIHSREDNTRKYNGTLTVSGTLYEYATVDRENTTKMRPKSGIEVKVDYLSRFRDTDLNGDVGEFSAPQVPTTTDANGRFSISINKNIPDNDKAGVFNGSTVRLELKVADGDAQFVERVSKELSSNKRFFKSWTWKVNVGVKNETLKDSYLPDRAVDYGNKGSFIFESGSDVRLDKATLAALPPPLPSLEVRLPFPIPIPIDGNRFSTTEDNTVIDNIDFGAEGTLPPSPLTHVIEAPIFITRASKPTFLPESVEPFAWYLQDKQGGFYLLKLEGKWKYWPDGQRFVSDYRIATALSTSALFSRQFQSQLVDSLTDNFSRPAPYANYNWELFLHAPLAIADYLASQQRFEDARRWLHAVFDPTTVKKDKTTNQIPQFWQFLPFVNATQPEAIAKQLTWLANPSKLPAEAPTDFEHDFGHQIDEWKKNPFMPHVIARLRPSAYQWHTFFAYLEVLIGWGDQLFRRDTRESVNDATLLYVLAAKLLGPRPRTIPAPTPPYALTYRLLPRDKKGHLDGFSNAWVDYADLPGIKQLARARTGRSRSSQSFALQKSDAPSDHLPLSVPDISSAIQHLTSLSALAFCIPQNEKVTEFYDRVENRLFNVRNCRNIEGVFRTLPLYEPPIDPLLLIRARAAGLTIDSVLADLYTPLPNYRFTFTLQKAIELCAELKALGGALLTALEKKDAEELTLLRSSHEITMLKLVRDTRKQQIAEAEANITALQQSEETILERFGQYQKLLGKPSITKGQDGLPVVEQSSSLTVATDPVGGASGLGLSHMEVAQLGLTAVAHMHTQAASSGHIVAGVLSLLPNIWAGGIFAGQTFGGINLGSAATAIGKSIEMVAADVNFLANQAGTFGGYERRQDEWVHQSKLALAELKQIQKQIVAADIRKDIAERELSNHDTQIDNAQEVEDFMRSKFTSQQLYRWMSSQIAQVYFRTYQLALDQARRTERTYQHELGLDDKATPFVQAGQWDSLKRGLLAGEHLHHDLKRMESAYLERNVREFEITKHVSLAQLDPVKLMLLRETGQCEVSLPEALLDMDFPGHYLRRIKSVSLTIPCVTGPYSSVPCTLTLLNHSVRHNSNSAGIYKHSIENDDPRFTDSFGAIQSIVTSSAQNDSGMFETNLRDERYLPFEGAGVISSWRIELPLEFRQFNYDTISDVILHIRYTAREGGKLLKTSAVKNTEDLVKDAAAAGSVRLFSVRHEFPTEWAKFKDEQLTSNPKVFAKLTFEPKPEHYPYWSQGSLNRVKQADVFAETTNAHVIVSPRPDGKEIGGATESPELSTFSGNLRKRELASPPATPIETVTLYFNDKSMDNIWLALAWGK